MGAYYTIYRPSEKMELADEVDFIHKRFLNSVTANDSEYFIEFSLLNIGEFTDTLERFEQEESEFFVSSDGFSCNSEDFVDITENIHLYDSCTLHSSGAYVEDAFGYMLTIDSKNLKLTFELGLPYKEIKKSKLKLRELLYFLNSEGIHLGFGDYDNIDSYLNTLVDLNSSTKPSFTWQLNIDNFSFKHGNMYGHNSKFGDSKDNSYRMASLKIEFPDYYFVHKNLKERDKIDKYSTRLIKALSKYFHGDKTSINFASSNIEIIDKIQNIESNNFRLSSKLDLSKLKKRVTINDINHLFIIGNNEYTLSYVQLSKDNKFEMKYSIEKEDDNELKLLIYVRYDYEDEEIRKVLVEEELGFELEYLGVD